MEISESNLTFDLSKTTTMEAERNTQVQEKVKRNEEKEIKAENEQWCSRWLGNIAVPRM